MTEIRDYKGRGVQLKVVTSESHMNLSKPILEITHPGGVLKLDGDGLDGLGSFVSNHARELRLSTLRQPTPQENQAEVNATRAGQPSPDESKRQGQSPGTSQKNEGEEKKKAEQEDGEEEITGTDKGPHKKGK